jgi:hypothetical protein
MKNELENQLFSKYPLLFSQRERMVYNGMSCDDGWYELLDELCSGLEKIIAALPAQEQPIFYAVQCKEKFGGLRMYLSRSTGEMDALIAHAEERAKRTCEVCGQPGSLDTSKQGWVRTLCPIHIQERQAGKNI